MAPLYEQHLAASTAAQPPSGPAWSHDRTERRRIRRDAALRLFRELRHRPLRDTEPRRRDDVGEHVEYRQAIERTGVHAGPGRRAAFHEIDRQRPVLWARRRPSLRRRCCRAAESRSVPRVDDVVIARRQQEHANSGSSPSAEAIPRTMVHVQALIPLENFQRPLTPVAAGDA